MRKWLVSTNDLLRWAGLERRSSLLSRSLPVTVGVGAGVVAGAGLAALLLTPKRRERLLRAVRGGRSTEAELNPEVVMHSDAPGTDVARRMNGHTPHGAEA